MSAASEPGVEENEVGVESVEGAKDGVSDDGFKVAAGVVGGRGIRRCLGIDAG